MVGLAVTEILCAECGSTLTKDEVGLWTDGGGPGWTSEGKLFERTGTMCSSGYGPDDHHVPDIDLPDSLEPAELDEWLAR